MVDKENVDFSSLVKLYSMMIFKNRRRRQCSASECRLAYEQAQKLLNRHLFWDGYVIMQSDVLFFKNALSREDINNGLLLLEKGDI